MTLFQLFKTAFLQPPKLIHAKEKSFWKILLYVLFLTLVMFIPVATELAKVVGTIQQDITKITNKLPDFSIKENKLVTDKPDAGFIYMTDYMIFSFDPEGKREAEDIHNDLIGNVIGLALLEKQLVFTVADDNLIASILPTNTIKIAYDAFDTPPLTKEWLVANASSSANVSKVLVIACLILLLPVLLDLIITLLLVTFLGNMFSRRRVDRLKFSDSFKIVVLAATVPITNYSIHPFGKLAT